MRMVKPMARLYEQLRKLPGIGSKSALRLSYHVLDMKQEDVEALAQALLDAKKHVHLCRQCFDLCEGDLCEICQDAKRDQSLVCVVEQPQDVAAMERTRGYQGLYHVLHGVLSPLDGIGPDRLKIRELLRRLQDGKIKEVILATNSDVEGEATANYLAGLIRPTGVKVSRIAHGLPVGGDLEYADELTLYKALENRREL
ncbi:recombination mediator RecR [Acidaminococcus sp. NSJ-142]|jgi:recombination protein RecR|uniref:recombination mediator RecR n=1 Tax=Acidaminococcus TaxID=904 RepID=UPI000CF9CDFA|nr:MULTISPECIES: recombination mediator RecR [Acidaminococcus]MCD2435246.1 recombination mediator RecR [Acidaminococcus hominis]MCH4097155.1 recombination mediator RecR [Acidaminococcus provencensis]RHK02064.1 recombination protein RecR [Acidaminococcus sp. AM05-11]